MSSGGRAIKKEKANALELCQRSRLEKCFNIWTNGMPEQPGSTSRLRNGKMRRPQKRDKASTQRMSHLTSEERRTLSVSGR